MISAARRPCFAAVAFATAGVNTGAATASVGTEVADDALIGTEGSSAAAHPRSGPRAALPRSPGLTWKYRRDRNSR